MSDDLSEELPEITPPEAELEDDFDFDYETAEPETDTGSAIAPRPAGNGEWLKFGVLVAIFAGVMLGVWLLAPSIFDWVVPAILGENEPAEVIDTDASIDTGTETEQPAEDVPEPAPEDDAGEPYPAVEDAATDEQATTESTEGEESVEAAEEPAAAPEGEVAAGSEESADPDPPAEGDASGPELSVEAEIDVFPHVVVSGETLNSISETYNVSVEDILAVNTIPNPNLIAAGTELQIPVQR